MAPRKPGVDPAAEAERRALDAAVRELVTNAPALATRSLLRPLGIVGYDAVEPALLAALATEAPLLLVSDHGASRSLAGQRDEGGCFFGGPVRCKINV